MRDDVFWLLPILVLAVYQVRFVWGNLSNPSQDQIEIPGRYSVKRKLLFYYLQQALFLLFVIQLSFPILTIKVSPIGELLFRIVGYALVIGGFVIALRALKDLGRNWMGMYDYGIKKGQELITNGMYKYVRHPIYLAILLEIAGFELVALSWLAVILPICTLIVILRHIEKEDYLLEKKFGKDFLVYKASVNALFPRFFLRNLI